MPYTNAFIKLKKKTWKLLTRQLPLCKLETHRHKALHELSDGLFQKTMIARALAQQTPLMLLDEPTAFLDYASRHELFILLKNLAEQQNKCILVSTHDLDLVLKYCDTIVVVHNGQAEFCRLMRRLKRCFQGNWREHLWILPTIFLQPVPLFHLRFTFCRLYGINCKNRNYLMQGKDCLPQNQSKECKIIEYRGEIIDWKEYGKRVKAR